MSFLDVTMSQEFHKISVQLKLTVFHKIFLCLLEKAFFLLSSKVNLIISCLFRQILIYFGTARNKVRLGTKSALAILSGLAKYF